LVALARANVERDRDKEITYRPRAELGVRLAKQLMKLTVSLCMVFQIEEPNDRVKRIIRKVALDTAIGFNLEIMLAIAHSSGGGLTREELTTKMNISSSKLIRHVSNLKELGIVREAKQKTTVGINSRRGRSRYTVRLTKDVQRLMNNLGFSGE
jgi:DNA-binding transcriptional ArsR family regulator